MKDYACHHCKAPMRFIDYNRNPYCALPACQQKRVSVELIENKRVAAAKVKNAAVTFLENNPEPANKTQTDNNKQALTVALVPSNNSPLTRLPEHRRLAFESHLRDIYRDVQADTPNNHPSYIADIEPDDPPAIKNLLGKACATCKGNCCRLGETHAFQDYWSLRRYLRTQAPITEDDLVTQFLSYLPEFSTNDACVFQGKKGCTLPENMRSITCNNHKCYPLIEFQRQIMSEPNGARAIGAVRGRNVDTIAVFTEQTFTYIEDN